jgi:hypothetical protein
MRRTVALAVSVISVIALALTTQPPAFAQRRHPPSPTRARPRPPVRRGAVVFVGGYFYDPFFGPYPWWPRAAYPYAYYPMYESRGILRVLDAPDEAAVYVDGFYAGIVDDFNGFFQGLPLPPGGHDVALYLEGFRTVRRRFYLAAGTTLKLHERMDRLPPGEASEPPMMAPPIPAPPEGSYLPPRTAPRMPPPPPPTDAPPAIGVGTLSLRVQPSNAELWIDGERWASSDGGRFVIQLPAGAHRVEVVSAGYGRYTSEIDVRDGETVPLNVSLMREHR